MSFDLLISIALWAVQLVVLVLVLAASMVLVIMPFRDQDDRRRAQICFGSAAFIAFGLLAMFILRTLAHAVGAA